MAAPCSYRAGRRGSGRCGLASRWIVGCLPKRLGFLVSDNDLLQSSHTRLVLSPASALRTGSGFTAHPADRATRVGRAAHAKKRQRIRENAF